MMRPLEIIAEWRKGCSCAGPEYERAFRKPEGSSSPAECTECTEAMVAALEQVLRVPTAEMISDGWTEDDRKSTRANIHSIYRSMTGAELKGCARCGRLPIRANLDGDDLCQSCCNDWVRGERQTAAEDQADERT